MFRIWVLLAVLLLGASTLAHASIADVSEQEKITYLFNVIGASKVMGDDSAQSETR